MRNLLRAASVTFLATIVLAVTSSAWATGTWTLVSNAPVDAYGGGTTSDGTYAYWAGGYSFTSGGNVTNFSRYDPLSDTWTPLAPVPDTFNGMASAVYSPINNKIYLFGGEDNNSATVVATTRIYDIASNTWSPGTAMPDVRAFAASGYYSGKIYIIGGYNTGNVDPSFGQVWEYDPIADTWNTSRTDMPATLGGPGFGVINGNIIIAGGRDLANTNLNTVYSYNVATDTWTTKTSMPVGENVPGSAVINGQLWTFGGGEPFAGLSAAPLHPGPTNTSGGTQIYDPASDTWNGAGPALNHVRSFPGGTNVGSTAVCIGGYDGSSTTNVTEVNVNGGSGCNGVWLAATPIPYDLARYAFVQNGDNLYVLGGVSDGTVVSNVSVFNADTNTWTPLAPIPAAVGEAPTAGIFNGKIYVEGGLGFNNLSIYDIASNTWTSGAPIPISTYGAAGGAFNGLFYVAGGTMGTDLQVYNIATNTWSTGAPVPVPYYLGGYTVLGQYLYMVGSFGAAPMGARAGSSLVGGHGSPVNSPDANDTETIRLDMSNGTWSSGPPWPMQRADMALASDGFSLYAIGGDITGGGFFDGSAEVDQLDLSAWPGGTWVVSPSSLPSPRQANQAGFFSISALFNSGEIWSSGGVTPSLGSFLNEHLYLGVCASCPFTYNITVGSGSIVPGTVDIGNHCDDCTTAVALPFPFNFHGTPYSSVNADSNGTLQFASSTSFFTNTCLPDASFSDAIFPFWDDGYTINAGFGIFTSVSGSAPNRIFNIEWRNQYFPGVGNANYEVRLYEGTGQIDVIYGASDDSGASATSGLQVGDGSVSFLQYECNTGGLTNGLMLTYARVPLTPVITPSGPTTFCQGGSVTLDAGAGYASYSWTPNGETTQTIVASATGSYDVTVTDSCGNSGTAPPVVVTANPNPTPTITPSGPTSFCAPGSVTLDAGAGYVAYLWAPGGATTQTIVVSASGSYTVMVTDGNGCVGTSAPTVVTVNPVPAPVITVNRCLPPNTPGNIASVPGNAGDAYVWTITGGTIDSGQGTASISFTSGPVAQFMTLSIDETSSAGCLGSAGETMQVNFADVPASNPFYTFICKLARNSITGGCGGGNYCPAASVLRSQMAVFLLRSEHGPTYVPPACTVPSFGDVPCSNPFSSWIYQLVAEGITGGCGGGNFCPNNAVLRNSMAVFLLVTEHGTGYTPPACTPPGQFTDVPCPGSGFTDWIYQLVAEGITGGCTATTYCPTQAVSRAQMSVFLVVTFSLP